MIARSLIVLMAELLIFYILGSGFIKLLKQKENFPIGVRIITGFFLYQILFQVMALPFAFLRERLSLLTICWNIFLLLVAVIGFFSSKKLISEEDNELPLMDIIQMNWLANNIIGEIPPVEAFKPEAQALIRLQGVKSEGTETEV